MRAIQLTKGWRLGAGALLLAASASACSSGSDHRAAATTTSAVPTTTSTTAAAEPAPVVAYRAFWQSYLAAADPMNPEDERLRQYATGDELRQVGGAFLARKSAGEVIRGALDLAPILVSTTDDEATVRDCYFDHTRVFNVSTNQPETPEDTARQLVTATLQRDAGSGQWRVARIKHEGSGCTSAS
jgi:uncharacterized protein (DUF1330 family)